MCLRCTAGHQTFDISQVDSAAPDSPSGAAKKPSKDERRAKKLKTRRPDLGPMDKRMMSVDETQ